MKGEKQKSSSKHTPGLTAFSPCDAYKYNIVCAAAYFILKFMLKHMGLYFDIKFCIKTRRISVTFVQTTKFLAS